MRVLRDSCYNILYNFSIRRLRLLRKLYTLKTKRFRALSFLCSFRKKILNGITIIVRTVCNTVQKDLEKTGLNSIPFAYEFDSDNSDYRLITIWMSESFMYKIKIGRAKNVCVVAEKKVCN